MQKTVYKVILKNDTSSIRVLECYIKEVIVRKNRAAATPPACVVLPASAAVAMAR